jgi:hypothetical protein
MESGPGAPPSFSQVLIARACRLISVSLLWAFTMVAFPQTGRRRRAEHSFDETCTFAAWRQASRFKAVFRRHALMTLVVVMNAVLR